MFLLSSENVLYSSKSYLEVFSLFMYIYTVAGHEFLTWNSLNYIFKASF